MLGMVIPKADLKNLVMTPALPSRLTHAYAPMNGADMDDRIMSIWRNLRPLISYMLYRYARGTPSISEMAHVHRATLKLLVSVLK